jgi:hypothetical protein
MKRPIIIGLAVLAGAALGALAVQGLHAQAKPPVYVVTEIDVTNLDAYVKEYAPKAQALIRSSGGRIIAAGQNNAAEHREPCESRGSCTDLGGPGGEIPPGDSTNSAIPVISAV